MSVDRLTIAIPPELEERIAERAAAIVLARLADTTADGGSRFLTIPEAPEFLRAKRHRVDDLLSRRILTRHKDGARTPILRAELEAYMRGERTGRRA